MSSIGGPFQPFSASRQIGQIQTQKASVLQQLATGSRINRAADDPAGLVSSEQIKAMLAELEAETRSLSRAQNVSRVVGSALGEVSDLLIEAEALAVANANTAGLSDAEREANQMELNSILAAVDRVSQSTSFGDSHLLRGNSSISINGASVDLESTAVNDLGQTEIDGQSYTLSDVGSGGAFAITGNNLESSLELIRAARQEVVFKQGEVGAFERNAIEPRAAGLSVAIESLSAANSSIRDTDYAKATAALARLDVLEGAAFRVTSAGAQLDPSALIRLLG
ncbi:MAG: hypothetical protein COB69_06910 [Phycisphaera sp.]|nr:MAG: hypothetical protein COB69_06910 [Phycisphaera sp.]